MTKVNVDRHTNRQPDRQDKNNMPLIIRSEGIMLERDLSLHAFL